MTSLKSDHKKPQQPLRLRGNIIFSIAEFLINVCLIFIGYRLLISHGGIESVGVWATLFAWTNIIRLADLGMSAAITRYVSRLRGTSERSRRLIRVYVDTTVATNIIQFAILTAAGAIVIPLFIFNLVGAEHAEAAKATVPIMMAGFFLANLSGTYLGILQALHQGYKRSILSVIGTAIQIIIALMIVPSDGIMGLAMAQLIQHSVIACAGIALVYQQLIPGQPFKYFSALAFKKVIGFSTQNQVINISNGVVEPLIKMLIAKYGGMNSQGLFELAFKTVMTARNLVGAGVSASLPTLVYLYVKNKSECFSLYSKLLRNSATSTLILMIGVGCAAPIASRIWLNEVNSVYWTYVGILAVGALFSAIGSPAFMLRLAAGKLQLNTIIAISAFLLIGAFGLIFGVEYGATGIVVTWVAINIVTAVALVASIAGQKIFLK